MGIVSQCIFLLLIGQAFCVQGQCDLDLTPTDPKINRGLLLIMTILHTKYGDCITMCCLVIDRTRCGLRTDRQTDRPTDRPTWAKQYTPSSSKDKLFVFKVTVTLTFDKLTPKSIGVFYWSWPTSIPNMGIVSQCIFLLLIGQAFCVQGQCDLDLTPTDPKINRGLLLFMTNLHTKYGDRITMLCLVIDRTSFLCSRSLWPWPLTNWHQNQ